MEIIVSPDYRSLKISFLSKKLFYSPTGILSFIPNKYWKLEFTSKLLKIEKNVVHIFSTLFRIFKA